MGDIFAKEPTRVQLFVFDMLNCVIRFSGMVKMWVISPGGKFSKELDNEIDQRVEVLEESCGWATQLTCSMCRQRHILFKVGDHYEIAPVWPGVVPDDDETGSEVEEEAVNA